METQEVDRRLNRKEQDVIDAMGVGMRLGSLGERWILYSETREKGRTFPKRETRFPAHKTCSRLVADGVIRRSGASFTGPDGNVYEQYVAHHGNAGG